MNNKVEWAVIPAAGRGTRFLPITKGVSKEMLNIVDRPTIDYIVDECINADIKNIVFIVSDDKEDIKKYYSEDKKFYDELMKNNKTEYASIVSSIPKKANFYYAYQKEMKGLGHAVLMAKDIIKDNNFVVCCGDDIVDFDKTSAVKELVDAFIQNNNLTVVGGKKVSEDDISKYGAMDIDKKIDEKTFFLKGIVEKPKKEEAPSLYASLGKWVFNSKIFEKIENTKPGKNGEIQLTDAIYSLIKEEGAIFYEFDPIRYDCGDKLGYLKAVIHFALKHDEYKNELLKYFKEILNDSNNKID